jgi:hypothetical protein
VGLEDRDYIREYSIFGGRRRRTPQTEQWDPAPARLTPRPRQRKKTITLTLGFPTKTAIAVIACAIGLAAVPAYHRAHDAWYGPEVKPMQVKQVPVRVWVPASKHGHVKVVQARIVMPSN